jgi:hypothetical protein
MAAGNTYVPITTQTLASAVSTVNLGSFSGYTDLRVVMTYYTSANADAWFRFNNDSTTTAYEQMYLASYGTASAATFFDNNKYTGLGFAYLNSTYSQLGTSIPGFVIMDIPYYTDTNTYKGCFVTYGTAQGGAGSPQSYATETTYTQWRSNSAITSINLAFNGSSTFTAGSTFTVYGIQEA